MDEGELRKSIRRQKLEKQGLVLAPQSAPSTGTGTGTSDDEDEGSTPSGDNADRSLASTLGGSSESIPQASSTFLQMALDGPGLSERGGPGRKSISAMHNTDASKNISKSFASTKKEELMKVINEAKQKLENVSHLKCAKLKNYLKIKFILSLSRPLFQTIFISSIKNIQGHIIANHKKEVRILKTIREVREKQ